MLKKKIQNKNENSGWFVLDISKTENQLLLFHLPLMNLNKQKLLLLTVMQIQTYADRRLHDQAALWTESPHFEHQH